jgi:4-hydroxythreonine-4-phosphate dehydrogenase
VSKQRILAVTPGDPDGIGPEIVWKAIRKNHYSRRGISLLCIGAKAPFEKLGAKIIEVKEGEGPREIPKNRGPFVWLLPAPTTAPKKSLLLPGFQSGWSIEKAVEVVQAGEAAALVTGPISKERFQKGGFPFPGHTEFLEHLCHSPGVTMMLANSQLRVTLVTIHTSLANVPREVTSEKVETTILRTASCLKAWWKIRNPRIAVAALNPHAGEGGLFGSEDQKIVAPAIAKARRKLGKAVGIFGPLPADTLFANHIAASSKDRFDAVVCMYHDQGLIPVKLLDFQSTVNITLGLPIIRTSVDHGVGFDIAGQGKADPSSFESAVELAVEITK